MFIVIIFSSITLLAILILIIKLKSDKLNFYNEKINESEKKLQGLLEQKFTILSELHQKIYSQIDEEDKVQLCNIEEIEYDDFLFNSILNKAYKQLKNFLEEKRAFIPDDETQSLLNKLHEVDIECKALKNYYNNNSMILNNLIKKFPNKIISKFQKLSEKELYNDPVEEEFEILKKK